MFFFRVVQRNFSGARAQWLVLLVLLCAVRDVLAFPIITPQVPLDFGQVALRSNAAVWSLIVSNTGTVTPGSSHIIPLGGAVRGEYRLTGFPPNISLTVEWDDAPLSYASQMHPEYLTVTDYSSPAVMTDALGEATVYLGATLKTSGNSVMYGDGAYGATTQMRVIYWLESMGQFVTHADAVLFSVSLKSTISVTQQQPLSFGLVAANSDPVLKATLRVNVSGGTSETPAGSARIRHLGGAQPAVMQVTGAAPNTMVNIAVDPGTALLTHVALGTGSPQFVVKDFVTDPASTGVTDASGILQVNIGATLETQATTSAYAQGAYSGAHAITVSY